MPRRLLGRYPGADFEASAASPWPSPILPFQLRGDALRPTKDRRRASDQAPAGAEERILVCASCDHSVTRSSWAIELDGSHSHTFLNPAGFVFHIGCFAEAPGAAPSGESSVEFSWFPGHSWRIAVCGRCAEQLGWRFEAKDHAFFGLVLARLRERG